ncbi:hypothetical protein E4P40_13830 [Blastococcus sp. CT_GayMR20]|uniref:DUF6049 family protein n=1 Tax=Blastococcus sp. CT_GayMR20 TaxID=2559609 RepID=UPI0010737759|nr:DUF6049 family protein [Blastococcus sp. CT_GayMR20]TFV85795.1 hypothetical protein E4P40_13830 [Blastococcus sp. CT_GayMR20]
MSRPALLRAAVAPLLATAFGVMAFGAMPSGVVAPVPVAHAAPADDDTRDDDRPVQIQVGRFEPRTLTPGATVTVTGQLVNTGSTAITDLSLRLQRGDVVTTRAELASLAQDPDPATTVEPPFLDVPGELAPGGRLDFSYNLAAEALELTQDGVYPVLINVNGAVDGNDQRRVGELPTYVVQQQVLPPSRAAVAWLWPLVERTHREPSGRFADDDLTEVISEGGRLDRALTVVERLPDAQAPGAPEPVPALPVTLAVDPALVEELQIMAAGPYEVGGTGTGRGTDAAAAFLERLAAVAAVHPVVALPYGDVDADALQASGMSEVLTRSLPGTPDGTAQDPPGDDAATPAAPATGTPAPAPEAEESGLGAGAEILAEALDVEPRTDVAWAAGGSLRSDTLATLQAGGVRSVVLGPGALADGDAAVGLSGPAAAARTSVTTPSGTLGALVADPTLGEIVGTAEQVPGGARLAEQRYLAELAVIGLQAPAGTEQTVLVAAPRDVEAGPEGAGAMMADTTAMPWLRAGSVDELAAGPATAAGDLRDPVDVIHLDATGLAAVATAVATRDDVAGAVAGDADRALRSSDAAISRTTTVGWRADPDGFRAAATALSASLDRLRGRVTLLAPADGTYSLASSDAPLVLTVRNDLPVSVEVLLEVRTRGNRGLSIGDIGTQTLAPGERTTLTVPTELRQSGGFAVTAQLTTPGGGPLGDEIQLQVKSTAYGPISLLITIGAAALLGLLFLRRLVNFVLRRRRAAREQAELGPGGPEGATVAMPPNRSPV